MKPRGTIQSLSDLTYRCRLRNVTIIYVSICKLSLSFNICRAIYWRKKVLVCSRKLSYPASDAIEEFLDIDFGDISKSESDLYRNDSLLCGKCWSTNPGEGPSKWSRAPGPPPLSTSKLKKKSDEFYNIFLFYVETEQKPKASPTSKALERWLG